MTVGELIEKLRDYPQDTMVWVYDHEADVCEPVIESREPGEDLFIKYWESE